MPLEEISSKTKLRHINYDKMNNMANNSVTMKEFMDIFFEKMS